MGDEKGDTMKIEFEDKTFGSEEPNKEFSQSLHWLARAVYDQCYEVINHGGSLIDVTYYLEHWARDWFWSGFHNKFSDRSTNLTNPCNDMWTVGREIGIVIEGLEKP